MDSLLLSLRKTPPQSETRVRILLDLCWTYNTYKPDSCILLASEAVRISQKIRNQYGIAEGTRFIALSNQRQGKFIEATRQYLRALPTFEQLNDSNGIANTLNGLGISYFEQANYGNALQYYRRAEPIFLKIQNMPRYAAALSNISYAYLEMNNLDSARLYADTALRIAQENNVAVIKVFALTNIADIFCRQKRVDSAFVYLRRIRIEEERATKNSFTLSRLHYIWGEAYIQTKEFEKAHQHLDSSLMYASEAGMRFRVRDAFAGFQQLYEAQGDFRRAYQAQSSVARYNDSLFNQESARQIADMQRELDIRNRNEQIELLTKTNELQSIQRNALIGFLLLVLLAGLGFLRLYRRTQAANTQLMHQNHEILRQQHQLAQQSEEIATINAQVRQKNEHLLLLNEKKNHFLAIAAHDLKNPLTGIRSLSDYLASNNAPSEEVQLLNSRISQTADRMFHLVQNLLDINAIESGGLTLNLVDVDILPIVENVVQQYMDAAIEKKITLRFMAMSDMPNDMADFMIRADENYMVQVLDNLISNAIKYSPLGKEVFVRLIAKPSTIRVEVQDQGQGLTNEDKQHLFDKFTKLSARPTGGEHSTGLGLSIVKQLVEMMHGTIRCESEYLQGATFIIEFSRATISR